MDLDSNWLPLADAVRRVVAQGVEEALAKVIICDAIAEKRLRLKAHTDGSDGRAAPPAVYGLNDVDIPGELNPNRLDWVRSRPGALYPWRTRSPLSADPWEPFAQPANP